MYYISGLNHTSEEFQEFDSHKSLSMRWRQGWGWWSHRVEFISDILGRADTWGGNPKQNKYEMKIPRFPGLFRKVYPGKEMAHLFGQDGANQSFAILQKIGDDQKIDLYLINCVFKTWHFSIGQPDIGCIFFRNCWWKFLMEVKFQRTNDIFVIDPKPLRRRPLHWER